jgi:flagellar secretion chaperone FliS
MKQENVCTVIKAYVQTNTHGTAADAHPHRLVQMLLEGALGRIALAKGCIHQSRIAEKCDHIRRAMSILEGLRMSLDKDAGGTIAHNLDDLYEYMGRRLLQANMEDNTGKLDEVAGLIGEIKHAWDVISPVPQRPGMRHPSTGLQTPMVG